MDTTNIERLRERVMEVMELEDEDGPVLNSFLESVIRDLEIIEREAATNWSNDSRPAPQVHYRVNVAGLKRVPDATFTVEGDVRDVNMAEFWEQRDAFQREVDRRFPLETLAHFVDLPPLDPEGDS